MLSLYTESELCDLGQVNDLAKPAFPFCAVERGSSHMIIVRSEKLTCAQFSAEHLAHDESPADVTYLVRMLLQKVGSRNGGKYSIASPSVSFIWPGSGFLLA